MSETQALINRMHNGEVSAILTGISSGSDILNLNAIITGTRIGLDDNSFILKVKALKNSDAVLLGTHLSHVAKAALDVLKIEEYSGDNKLIKELIDTRFVWLA